MVNVCLMNKSLQADRISIVYTKHWDTCSCNFFQFNKYCCLNIQTHTYAYDLKYYLLNSCCELEYFFHCVVETFSVFSNVCLKYAINENKYENHKFNPMPKRYFDFDINLLLLFGMYEWLHEPNRNRESEDEFCICVKYMEKETKH